AGITEHLDVLGGYDWLRAQPETAGQPVGLMGFSLGGATAAIAFSEEPEIAALWSDSAYGNLRKTIELELETQYGIPGFLARSSETWGQLVGYDITAINPEDGFGDNRNGRPVFLVHGTEDTRIDVAFANELALLVQATDPAFEPWVIDGIGHTAALFERTDDYTGHMVSFFEEALGANGS
ncbi:MAG: prolyl oligopeptidase family serine peptidase, partial [Chloroflexota bacterium]